MNFKLLPYTGRSTVPIASVSPASITPGTRAQKPYPPGKVQVNGQYWPDGGYLGAVDAVLTWAHRHRQSQTGWAVVAQDAVSVAAGPEGTYTVEVLVDGAVKQTQTGISGTSYTYTMAQRAVDDGDLSKPVQFRITPVNGSVSGAVRTTDPFVMQVAP